MNVKNLVLGIGIFIVYMLVLNYGIEAFYPSPKYDNYCNSTNYFKPLPFTEARNCTAVSGLQQQEQACYNGQGMPVYNYSDNGCVSSLTCDYCSRDFNEANKGYSKVIFFVAIIVGIITLLVGFSVLSVEPVGSALMASGVGAIFYGSVRNWQNLSDIWRFLLLLVALVLLIWIALRLNKGFKEDKGKKKERS